MDHLPHKIFFLTKSYFGNLAKTFKICHRNFVWLNCYQGIAFDKHFSCYNVKNHISWELNFLISISKMKERIAVEYSNQAINESVKIADFPILVHFLKDVHWGIFRVKLKHWSGTWRRNIKEDECHIDKVVLNSLKDIFFL